MGEPTADDRPLDAPAGAAGSAAQLHDAQRLRALAEVQVIDTPPEASFDRLTRLAALLLDAPIAAASFLDEHHQFLKSSFGLPEQARSAPASSSICQLVVTEGDAVVIDDVRDDERLRGHPSQETDVRAYAGVPIVAPDGAVLGSMCVADREPRTWTQQHIDALRDLSALVGDQLHLRVAAASAQRAGAAARAQLEVTRTLAETRDFDRAGPLLLERMGTALGWSAGAIWLHDVESRSFRPHSTWHGPDIDGGAAQALSSYRPLAQDEGIVGLAWTQDQAVWVQDVSTHPQFVRHDLAQALGVRASVCQPLASGSRRFGVLEFFHRSEQPPSAELQRMLRSVGQQLALYLEACTAEGAATALQALELNQQVHRPLTTALLALELGHVDTAHDAVADATAAVASIVRDIVASRSTMPLPRRATPVSVATVPDASTAARSTRLVGDAASAPRLSPREREVLALIAKGQGNREIAAELGLSADTVKSHVSSLLRKLGVGSRSAALMRALRLGLLG